MPAFVPMLIGSALSAYGAYEASRDMDDNLDEVEGFLKPWKDASDDLGTLANDYMNRGSQINQEARSDIRQSALDFVAAGNRMNQRNLSSGGLGGFSGLANQNLASNTQQALSSAEDSFQKQFATNRATGTSLLDNYIKNQKDYGETMAQGWIQNDQMKRQMQMSMYGGLGQGLTQGGMNMGEGWSAFGGAA